MLYPRPGDEAQRENGEADAAIEEAVPGDLEKGTKSPMEAPFSLRPPKIKNLHFVRDIPQNYWIPALALFLPNSEKSSIRPGLLQFWPAHLATLQLCKS